MEAARCLISVEAGVLPGTPEHFKQWGMTQAQWEAQGGQALQDLVTEAQTYAAGLMMAPHRVNYVKVEWVWL